MVQRTSTSDLDRMLAAAGVEMSADEFVHRVGEALADYRATPASHEPERELDQTTRALLEEGGLDFAPLRPDEPDPLAATAAEYVALLADSMTVDEAAATLGVDPSRVRQLLRARGMYGIRVDEGWRIPRGQFRDGRQVPHIGHVLAALPTTIHPVAAWRWLTWPDDDLEIGERRVSPLDWLASGGDPTIVVEIAADL